MQKDAAKIGEFAPFAVDPARSRGRFYDEKKPDFRSPFQRDRDRIVHSTAFRRLAQKTQVFVSHEGDLFRSRLTHSLEVAQVARALARRFEVNEDLAEAVSLSHDLGHPPFGHTGEDALSDLMSAYGGFDHNAQALRIVTLREERYASFMGLNLTWETLEGMAKHNGPMHGEVPWAMADLAQSWDLELRTHSSLEAQIAAVADDIAYNHHDLQDGIRSGLISDIEVADVPLMNRFYEEVKKQFPQAPRKIQRYEALSKFFSAMVQDVYEETSRNLAFSPQSPEELRAHPKQVARFSDTFFAELYTLRAFLFSELYRHKEVMKMRSIADEMLRESFAYAFAHPESLPEDWRQNVDIDDDTTRARLVCDYISGMTDSYLSQDWSFAHGKSWPEKEALIQR